MQFKFSALYSSNIINWSLPWLPDELVQQIRDDPEKYRNLYNIHWWKRFMNERERNLGPHPNRSPGFIPHRIHELRDAAEYEIVKHFIPRALPKPTWSYTKGNPVCLDCGMSHDEMSQADTLMKDCLKPYRDTLTYQDAAEWNTAVANCLEQVKPQVHPSAFSTIQEQEMGSWSMSRGFPLGFCPNCYDAVKSQVRQNINGILEES